MDSDERLEEVESQLDRLERRLKRIEELLSSQATQMDEVNALFRFFRGSMRFYDDVSHLLSYISSFKKASSTKWISKDPLAKAILVDLARRGPRNISQLTRDLREERGKASRRIVSERVDRLIEEGVLTEDRHSGSRRLRLGSEEAASTS